MKIGSSRTKSEQDFKSAAEPLTFIFFVILILYVIRWQETNISLLSWKPAGLKKQQIKKKIHYSIQIQFW